MILRIGIEDDKKNGDVQFQEYKFLGSSKICSEGTINRKMFKTFFVNSTKGAQRRRYYFLLT